jgi:hypothetical protein
MEAFPFLFMLLIFAVALIVGQATKAEQSRKLSAFVRSLEGGRGQTEQGFFDGLASTWVKGTLRGRPITLDFERRGSGKHKYTVAQYGVEVDNAAGDFDLSKGNAFDWLGKLFGLVEAPDVHPELGTDVVLRGSSAASRRLLQQGELATELRGLLDGGFTVVRLASGRLMVERRVDGGSLDLARLNAVYARLGEVADLCERRKVTVKVKGRASTRRFAWTGGGQASLCPYCRDEVALDREGDDDLTACERCETVHHRACFDEAGGCTIFGCGQRRARAPERG